MLEGAFGEVDRMHPGCVEGSFSASCVSDIPEGFAAVLPAPPAGFEPSTYGSGGRDGGFAARGSGSQVVENVRKRTGSRLQNSQPVALIRRSFGASLVHGSDGGDGSPGGVAAAPDHGTPRLRVVAPPPGEMLTVREVAAALRVSTATVYKLVATGEFNHVRVGNSIRIQRAALGAGAAPSGRS
jgi:excisionase family DNA binding protein